MDVETAPDRARRAGQHDRALPQRPVVGRGSKVLDAVLAAALAELVDVGYAGLTIDNVALRAGVHKTTVYRHWTDRKKLVVEALTTQLTVDMPIPDTGSIDADARDLARALVTWLNSPTGHAITTTVMSDAARIPEIAAVKRAFFQDRFRRAEPVVARAIQRGELPTGTDSGEFLRLLIAPIYLRLLVMAQPIDQRSADRAAQAAVCAARSGVLECGPVDGHDQTDILSNDPARAARTR
jgi:AcrR family transcriptional regulator